jgi:hypothetical protein
MIIGPELLLIGSVAAVGVLHTIVPDHWLPITLIARQRGWSKAETARASFQAGIGHVLSTLAIALVVWLAGAAVATHFGHIVDTVASIALIAFGTWIAISAWRELSGDAGHGHSYGHGHGPNHAITSHISVAVESMVLSCNRFRPTMAVCCCRSTRPGSRHASA